MRDNFKVIDADRHVLEPTDLYEKYLPAKFRGRVKIEGPNQSRRSIDGGADFRRRPDASRRQTGGLRLYLRRVEALARNLRRGSGVEDRRPFQRSRHGARRGRGERG